MKILNCRNFSCKHNDKGECRLENVTLQDDGSQIINQVICLEAESKGEDAKPIDIETAWGAKKKNLFEQAPKNHFAPKDEEVPG